MTMTEIIEQAAAPAPSPAGIPADHDGQLLCYVWGESNRPIAAIVTTRDAVVDFVCDQWFGERPETMHDDNLKAFNDFMAEFDGDDWEFGDSVEWKFEIGGIRVTKIYEAASGSHRALSPDEARAVDEKLGLEELPPIRLVSEVVDALKVGALKHGKILQAHVRELLTTAIELPPSWRDSPITLPTPPVVAALRECHDDLKSLNKTVGFRDGEWDSLRIAREALASYDAGASDGDGIAALRITSWPTGPEYHFEPDRELLDLPPGTYRVGVFPLPPLERGGV